MLTGARNFRFVRGPGWIGPAPEQVQALLVTEGTLNALGVQPILGRWFTPKDDAPGSPEPVILVYGYWQRRFGGDRSVIGRQIRLDGTPKEIIGVMPQSFRFLDMKPELIQPFRFNRAKTTLGNFSYQGIARLKPGVSLAQANTRAALASPWPARDAFWTRGNMP